MENDATAHMADIRKYEETLAKDPLSYCFAPLSDVYRRVGRVDDALEVALRGCELHPGYIGGYMALGRACFEKGLLMEGRQALAKVVEAMPDNLLALRLLADINRALDDAPAAVRSEAAVGELEEEATAGAVSEAASAVFLPDEQLSEDDDIVELTEVLEMVEEEDDSSETVPGDFITAGTASVPPATNPLNTATLAELYVSQGFIGRALAIYRELLTANPENDEFRQRIESLVRAAEEDRNPEGAGPDESLAAVSAVAPAEPVRREEERTSADPEMVLETLEGWLANIRRRR